VVRPARYEVAPTPDIAMIITEEKIHEEDQDKEDDRNSLDSQLEGLNSDSVNQ
jgi:hypothetical protein